MSRHVVWVDEATDESGGSALIGGKGNGLAELGRAGLAVPQAFVVTTHAFRDAVAGPVAAEIARRCAAVADEQDLAALDVAGAEIRDLLVDGTEDAPHDAELRAALRDLEERCGEPDLAVAVRSSSAAEDAADKSFAGEHDTYLWVRGEDEVALHVRRCWASLFTSRALAYRRAATPSEFADDAMAVVVQRMVDARSAGVLMTLNPANGDRSKVVMESLWGLGEPLVSGTATPDRFVVDKVTREIVSRELADKPERLVHDRARGWGTTSEAVEAEQRECPSLTDPEILALVDMGRTIERHAGCPQDVEFAVADGGDGDSEVLLLQSRPETVWRGRGPRRVSTSSAGSVLGRVVEALVPPKT